MSVADVLQGQVLGIFVDESAIVGFEDAIDIITDQVHDIKIEKSTHPIEAGSAITDNSIVLPRRLRIQGYTSNLQQTFFVGLPAPERAKEAWTRIVNLAETRETVDVLTTLELLEGYLITGLTATSNERTGSALEFVMELEEVQFANSEFTTLPADIVDGGPAENKAGTVEQGQKQSVEPNEAQESTLSKILGLL